MATTGKKTATKKTAAPKARSPRGTTKVSSRTAERRAEEDVVQAGLGVPPSDPVDGPPVDLGEDLKLPGDENSEDDLGDQSAGAENGEDDLVLRDMSVTPRDDQVDPPVVTPSDSPDKPAAIAPVTSPTLGYMHPQGSPERPVEVDLPPQDRQRPAGAPLDGWLLWPGDPVLFPHTDYGMWVVPKINIYRMFFVRGSKRPSFQTVFPAGLQVARTQIEKMNSPLVTAVTEDIAAHRTPWPHRREESFRI